MMLNLIDALTTFGNPVQLVGIMSIAAIAVVGDAVPVAHPPARPDAPEPISDPQVQTPGADVTRADVRGPIAVPRWRSAYCQK